MIQFKHSISFIDPPRKVRSSQEQDRSRWIHLNVAPGHMGLVALEDDLLHSRGGPKDVLLTAGITQIYIFLRYSPSMAEGIQNVRTGNELTDWNPPIIDG